MGELEPMRDRPAHELCILVQGVAPTAEMAEEICMIGTRQMFYARLPDVKGSAGSVALRARRGPAREPGLPLDGQPHAALRRSARALPDAHDVRGHLTATAMKTQKLSELAKTIRSKNAGVNLITFDIIFAERSTYERVKRRAC